MDREIIELFREILLACDEMGLIGREMFAVDGCKLPSNASKEWSGTKADFKKKCVRLEKAIERIVKKHRTMDEREGSRKIKDRDEHYIATLRKQLKKIRSWMDDNDEKPGHSSTPIKSNITDNESAKMKTSNGVIQGYNGVAMVDDKHQVIVAAEAFGKAQEYGLLKPMIDSTRANFQAIHQGEDVFAATKLTADSGFHTTKNMEMLAQEEIDGYVADRHFRRRDPRFDNYGRYKERSRKERQKREKRKRLFSTEDFTFDPELKFCVCPAGKLKVNCQWLLYCAVHNLKKVHKYGLAGAT